MATEAFLFGDFVTLPAQVGPFRVLDRVGVGGMSEVFRAELAGALGFTRTVVLKRILPEHRGLAQLERAFQREAQVAALLNHPGLMQCYELVDVEGELFLVMEHVAGLDLSRLKALASAADARIPFEVVAGVITDVALGLHHMHNLVDAQGRPLTLIHRDVSPDNIVLSHAGSAKLIDFGIAKGAHTEQLTTVGELRGKLRFMPPEQLKGRPLGPPADLFSLGVTLYWLLTGRHPFRGPGQLDVIEKILSAQPRSPRAHDPAVPEDLAALALDLLHKDEGHRPNAMEVYGRLLSHWPRDVRPCAAFLKRMLVDDDTSALVPTAAEMDDDNDTPTEALAREESAYRDLLQLKDNALIAVADSGAREVTHSLPTVDSVYARPTALAPPALRPAPRPARGRPPARSTRYILMGAALGFALLAATVLATVAVGTPAASPRNSGRAAVRAAARPMDTTPHSEPVPLPSSPPSPSPVPVVAIDAAAPADAPPSDTGEVGLRATARTRVEVRGPDTVDWRVAGGPLLRRGAGVLKLPGEVRELQAHDSTTGGKVRVAIVEGVADFSAVPVGSLQILVFPFGVVTLGARTLGESPVEPVRLAVGRYRVQVKNGATTSAREVEVTRGTNTAKFVLDGSTP